MKLTCVNGYHSNFFKWKRPCLLSVQCMCCFAYRRMSSVCSVFQTCLKCICRPASFVNALKWNVFTADFDESTYSQNAVESGFTYTSHNCSSLSMADVDVSDTVQSQTWKRMDSFKRRLFSNSSVLPSAVLEMVTENSQSVLSQQSNSEEMPVYCSSISECPELEQMHSITSPNSTVVDISEDSREDLNTTEACAVSPDSLDSTILLMGDELVTLFDPDNHNESDTSAAASSCTSEFLPFCLRVACYYIICYYILFAVFYSPVRAPGAVVFC